MSALIATIASPGLSRHAMLLRAGATQAIHILEWLLAEGFEPTCVTVDVARRYPVVTVKTIGKCELLKKEHHGAPHIIKPGRFGRTTTFRASIMGCAVEWTEGGH